MEVERPGVTQRDEGTGPRLSRRSFLEGAVLAGAAFGGAGLLGRGAPAQAAALPDIGMDAAQPAVARGLTTPLSHVRRAQPASFEPDVWVRRPFALSEVTIDGGVYRRGRDQGMVLARAYSVDTILAVFRRNAGLDTKGATPPGGWEEHGPAPDVQRWGPSEYKLGQNKGGAGGLLRGHYGGHFLTMLSMAYACSGEEALKDKVAAVVSGLKECQRALAAQTVNGAPRYSHPGYLSAYGEWQFSALEEYAPYGEIWAPYYTLHKILDGLNHAYLLTGNAEALEVAEGVGRWVHSRLSKCSKEQLAKMWSIYIAGEYGGMNDVLIDLYSASKAADRNVFLEAARLFDMDSLLSACAEGRDVLTDKHANQHIPQFVGYAKLYSITGDERYLKAVQGFFDMIVPGRTYAHGGTGEGEMWGPPNTVAGDIGRRNAESCAAYNMVKVAWQLHLITGEQRYADYCERTVLNHILGGHRDRTSTTSPENLYMFPVHAGAAKEYGDGNIGTCCGGTGLESPMRYQETAYSHSADGPQLFVNLYMSSTLTWTDRGLSLTQATEYPRGGEVRLRFTRAPADSLTLCLRIPEWVTGRASVTVNGVDAGISAAAGTYASIERVWHAGDEVLLSIPMRTWVDPALDRPSLQALRFGPMVLAAVGKESRFPQLALSKHLDLSGSLDSAVSWSGDQLVLAGRQFDPLYAGHDINYSTYFERVEKTVAFGGQDSGVANPSATDGTTLLDAVWEGAPFASRNAFLDRVRAVSKQFQDDGKITARQRQMILLTASRARMEER